ncbi:MAG: cation diffusion facilitator family transporter [Halobacteriota archaeon]
MASTKRVVLAAFFANLGIAIAKFVAWTMTGSSSMLSETYHSLSDTGNQVLLLLGIRLSEKEASRAHPFGRGKEQFFFAFVVSVMLFAVAGYASFRHGYHKLGSAHVDRSFTVNYVVLALALAFETYALYRAYSGVKREMSEEGFDSIAEAFRRSKDAPLITALTEDAVAVAGILVAFAGVGLTDVTGESVYDASASIVIGGLLMSFALALAYENRGLIVGEGVTARERESLVEAVSSREHVTDVVDLRTLHLGPASVLVAVEVAFDSGLTLEGVEEATDGIERAIQEVVPEADRIYVESNGSER